MKPLKLAGESSELRERLIDNNDISAEKMTDLKFDILPGEHPIVPIMFGEAERAAKTAEAMLARGVYVVAFSYPVVPMGKARIRTQISAAHSREDLEFAVKAFVEVRKELGL